LVAIVVLPEPPLGFRTRMRCIGDRAYAGDLALASM
jgi:hypothetical protein